MIDSNDRPLIVGAGPVGLAAALFLARHGVAVRLIDQAAARSPWSRALAVNPRPLRLLRSKGVADAIKQLGSPLVGAQRWREGKAGPRIDFVEVDGRRRVLVALSQAVTERLLRERYVAAGGTVENCTALTDCRVTPGGVTVTLEAGGRTETCHPPWVFADGAHSATRHALGLKMIGDGLKTPWHLADVPVETPMPADRANLVLLRGSGFLFALPVVGEAAGAKTARIWRVMGNVPDPPARLPVGRPAGEAVWTSTFRIVHRRIERQSVGPVYFGGDAAHLHSPVGARGMNLDIKDAWVFAGCVADGRPGQYGPLRERVDRRVVSKIRRITKVVIGESTATRALRSLAPLAMRSTVVRQFMTRTLTGLDHPLRPEPR